MREFFNEGLSQRLPNLNLVLIDRLASSDRLNPSYQDVLPNCHSVGSLHYIRDI